MSDKCKCKDCKCKKKDKKSESLSFEEIARIKQMDDYLINKHDKGRW